MLNKKNRSIEKPLQSEMNQILKWKPWLYVMPALIFSGLFVVYPVMKTVINSFWEGNLLNPYREFAGFANYFALFKNSSFLIVLLQSIEYLLYLLVGVFVVPIFLGFFTVSLTKRETAIFQTAFFLPTIIAANIAVNIWIWFFNPTGGLFNELQMRLCMKPIRFLKEPSMVIPAISVVSGWKHMGFHYLIALAGIKSISQDLIDAANVDGAGKWKTVFKVQLPLLSPTALFLFVVTLIQGMDYTFVPIEILTDGGPVNASTNLMYLIYQEGLKSFRIGMASAESVILILLFGGFIYMQYKMMDRIVYYEH